MLEKIVHQIGLGLNEATIYDYLLKNGSAGAGEIIKKTPLKRGVVYNALDNLANKGLIERKKGKQKAFFSPNHPQKLLDYAQSRRKEFENAVISLEANLPEITSSFNLISGKPGVKFFEGIEGVKKVIFDSLESREEIYTYVDAETVIRHIEKINNKYIRERNRLGIRKKMILPDSDFSRKFLSTYHRQVTDVRLIDHNKYPFASLMQIYDNKISYVNFVGKSKIGIIIEDPTIYQMHRNLFDFTWEKAEKLDS